MKPTFLPLVVLCAGLLVIVATPLVVNAGSVQAPTSLNLASGAPTASRCPIQRQATLLEAIEYTLGVELPLSPQLQDSKCFPLTALHYGIPVPFFLNRAGCALAALPRWEAYGITGVISILTAISLLLLLSKVILVAYRACSRPAHRLRHSVRLFHPVYAAQEEQRRLAQEKARRLAEANKKSGYPADYPFPGDGCRRNVYMWEMAKARQREVKMNANKDGDGSKSKAGACESESE
ncbi:hypothetical protein K438DRAFT_1814660 [Mycena galopus ATCC 62051]|nr:hypothetical protein K438DRAFT_1814660 [Mycena galopus ATCC 62051]